MSGLEVGAVTLVALWLGVLTLVVLVLVRQVAIIGARPQLDAQSSPQSEAGLLIGTKVPADAQAALGDLNGGPVYLLFLSPTCRPCVEIASELSRQSFRRPVLALFAGNDDMAADFQALFPPTFHVIRDPAATSVAEALEVHGAPFALQIESGVLTGKARLRGVEDLAGFIEAYDRSGAADIAKWGGMNGAP